MNLGASDGYTLDHRSRPAVQQQRHDLGRTRRDQPCGRQPAARRDLERGQRRHADARRSGEQRLLRPGCRWDRGSEHRRVTPGPLANLAPLAGGTLVIADNVTAGTLTIAGGAYEATNSPSFGPAILSLDGGTLAATTALTGSNAIGNVLTLTTSGAGSRTLNFGGSSMLQLSSPLVLSGTTTINDPGGVGILSGVISGSGLLSLSGSPTLTNANTYSGGTKLNSGEARSPTARPSARERSTSTGGGFQADHPLDGAAITNPWAISKGSAAYFGPAAAPTPSSFPPALRCRRGHRDRSTSPTPGLTVTLSGSIAGNRQSDPRCGTPPARSTARWC